MPPSDLRVLFFVEGFTDIRFVVGLSRICDLTMALPAQPYHESGLARRVAESNARLTVHQIPGGRLGFQLRSLAYLLRRAGNFDVILAQEVLRGALNANIAGRIRKVPVVTYMGISPLEYFRCRRLRREIGPVTAWVGEVAIRLLMWINGRLAHRCLAMGPYLRDVAAQHSSRTAVGLYYGVDTDTFRPADGAKRAALRRRLDLPADRFLIFLSSRMSHEKDPETVIRATALARSRGLDAVLLNLGGGYREFLALAREIGGPETADWVIARPAVDPRSEVAEYFQAADAVALASFAEGAAFSTLEALACGTPLVATAVGGPAVQLDGYADLTAPRNADAMADALLRIAEDPVRARQQALRGREYVTREWGRDKAFADLRTVLSEVAG